jgi:hypothetical protein
MKYHPNCFPNSKNGLSTASNEQWSDCFPCLFLQFRNELSVLAWRSLNGLLVGNWILAKPGDMMLRGVPAFNMYIAKQVRCI